MFSVTTSENHLRMYRFVGSEVGGILVKPVLLEGSCKTSERDHELGLGPSVTSARASSGKELTREPYTCERLTHIRGGYRALTASSPALQFDFNDPEVQLVVENTTKG